MSLPTVVNVEEDSPAARSGVRPGDEIVAINGQSIADVIQYRLLVDEPDVLLELRRGTAEIECAVRKQPGESLGIEVDAAVFDRVRTCDNHCEFCFIYQLPKGLRRSLYLKDDDYRLSFLYGNFTTLTRFTEADLERVIVEGLSPLFVSIHATDPGVRSDMLKNRRGGMSLRWLRALLDHGIEVHGQIVLCPGVNDGAVLEQTCGGVLEEYPELADIAVVPIGLSKYNTEKRMRVHTAASAAEALKTIRSWQQVALETVGHRLFYASDELYLIAGWPLPPLDHYGDLSLHEDGVGMIRAFEAEFQGERSHPLGIRPGFFSWADGVPPSQYRPQARSVSSVNITNRAAAVGILTGAYAAPVLNAMLKSGGYDRARVIEVENVFFGGNTAVAGLMVGEDINRALSLEPAGDRYLLPDVCLNQGRFLDGKTIEDLVHPVEVIPTDGVALKRALR